MTPPLTLGIVGLTYPPEPFVERLLAGLRASGDRIVLFGTVPPPKPWLKQRGWQWRRTPWTSRSSAAVECLRGGSGFRGMAAADHVDDLDLLYAPWINTPADHPALFDLGPPLVVSCRGALISIAPWDPQRQGFRRALPQIFARSAAVHCVSEAILDEAQEFGLDPAKATVIRPAVNPDLFRPSAGQSASKSLRVIGVGSLIWRKDYEHALVGLAKAVEHGVDAELTIVGEGPDRERLLYTVLDLDLGDRVHLLGRRPPDEVAGILARSDVFLHTSSSEGISNAVLEAMASGLAVISTDAGGMREVIDDGTEGLLVAVRDADAVGASLALLADDSARRLELGRNARGRIERELRLDQQVAAFRGFLRSAASGNR